VLVNKPRRTICAGTANRRFVLRVQNRPLFVSKLVIDRVTFVSAERLNV
jgi:hypothetical protein